MKVIDYAELTPGLAASGVFVLNMPNDAYHSYPAWNNSSLTLIARSPAHYRYSAPRDATRAMEVGTAIHAAILEPERFASEYMLLRDVTDRRASAYKEAAKQFGDERVLTGTEAVMVAGIQESVRHPLLDQPGQTEVTVFATCPDTGLLVKARFDYLNDAGHALDLKSTTDARPSEFAKAVHNYRYHVQDAFYRHVYAAATGRPLESFEFLAIEKEPPYFSQAYTMDAETQEIGRYYMIRDLQTAARCEASNDWPAPVVPDNAISLPGWAVHEYETDIEDSIT